MHGFKDKKQEEMLCIPSILKSVTHNHKKVKDLKPIPFLPNSIGYTKETN
jgi:hypothetical protein